MALIAGMYWIWWDSFHEMGRFFMQVPFPYDSIFLRYSTISCFSKQVGVVTGCILLCVLLRYRKKIFSHKHLPVVVFVIEIMLHLLYYILIESKYYIPACSVYVAISVFAVLTILFVALQMRRFENREIVFVVIGAIACYGIFNNFLFPYFLLTVSLSLVGFVYLLALVAAFLLSRSFSAQSFDIDEPNRESSVRTPLPLAAHLCVYGLAFGILHVIGGAIARGPHSTNVAVFFACIVTIVCIAFLFLRKSSNHEIWSKIRSTVFPLSIIGYMLVPLVSNSDAALAMTEAGNLLYNAIFFIGCFVLMRKTYVDPRAIIAKGLLYKNVGMSIGILWARYSYERTLLDGIYPTLLPVIIVLLLTVATFWVGSDEQIRKIWGLRKNLSPKQYNDRMIQLKTQKITCTYSLTSRESEILLLLTQGMRAPEIAESLGVSVDTVRSHTKHLYAKLDVHSLKELRKTMKDIVVDEREIDV